MVDKGDPNKASQTKTTKIIAKDSSDNVSGDDLLDDVGTADEKDSVKADKADKTKAKEEGRGGNKIQRNNNQREYDYAAYISFAQKDATIGSWLQKRMEGYRVPTHLVGIRSPIGPLKEKIGRIYCDPNDYSADAVLSDKAKKALRNASALVVLGSLDGANSPTVNEEVKYFIKHGSARRIYVLLTGMEREAEEKDLMPPALRRRRIPVIEARQTADNYAAESLEIIAYVTGLDIDLVKSREIFASYSRLKIALWTTTAAASIALVSLVWGGLSYYYGATSEERLTTAVNLSDHLMDQSMAMRDRYGVPLQVVNDLLTTADQRYHDMSLEAGLSDDLSVKRVQQLTAFSRYFSSLGQYNEAEKRNMIAINVAQTSDLAKREDMAKAYFEALYQLANVRIQKNDLPGSLETFMQALDFADKQVSNAEESQKGLDWLRYYSRAWNGQAQSYLLLGQYDDALNAIDQAKRAAQQSWRGMPESSVGGKRQYAEAQMTAGDVFAAMSNANLAQEQYDAALQSLRQLAAQPNDEKGLQELIYLVLGKVNHYQPPVRALSSLDEMLSITKSYLVANSDDRLWLRRQGQVWHRMAQVQSGIPNADARQSLDNALAILEPISERADASIEWLDLDANVRFTLAQQQELEGDLVSAAENYEKSAWKLNQLIKVVGELTPENSVDAVQAKVSEFGPMASRGFLNASRLQIASGDLTKATELAQNALYELPSLPNRMEGDYRVWELELEAYLTMAEALLTSGAIDRADEQVKKAFITLKETEDRNALKGHFGHMHGLAWRMMGGISSQQGMYDQALEQYQSARDFFKARITELDETLREETLGRQARMMFLDAQVRTYRDYYHTWRITANLYQRSSRPDMELQAIETALAILDIMPEAAEPTAWKFDDPARIDFYRRAAMLHERAGRTLDAIEYFEKSIEAGKELMRKMEQRPGVIDVGMELATLTMRLGGIQESRGRRNASMRATQEAREILLQTLKYAGYSASVWSKNVDQYHQVLDRLNELDVALMMR